MLFYGHAARRQPPSQFLPRRRRPRQHQTVVGNSPRSSGGARVNLGARCGRSCRHALCSRRVVLVIFVAAVVFVVGVVGVVGVVVVVVVVVFIVVVVVVAVFVFCVVAVILAGFKWVPLVDFAGPADSALYSANALALDPANGSVIYALTGPYWAYSNCTVLASRDAGTTWTVMRNATFGWGLTCGGNEGNRAVGDRLAVSPSDPATIAVGGADGRVYITVDGFVSGPPARVTLPPPASSAACEPAHDTSCVVLTVAWVPQPATGLPALVAAVPALGLFTSAGPDYADPETWRFLAGSDSPKDIARLAVVSPSQPLASSVSSASAAANAAAKATAATAAAAAGGRVWATTAGNGVWSGVVDAVTWDVQAALADEGVAFAGLAVRAGGRDVAVMSLGFVSLFC